MTVTLSEAPCCTSHPVVRELTMMSPLSRSAGSMVTHRRLPPVPCRSLRRSQQLWTVTTQTCTNTLREGSGLFAVTDPCQVFGKKKKTWLMWIGGDRRGETLTICLKCKPAAWTGRSSGRGSNLEERRGEEMREEGRPGQRRSGRHRRAAINVRAEECADCRPTPAGINQQIKNKQRLAWAEGDRDRGRGGLQWLSRHTSCPVHFSQSSGSVWGVHGERYTRQKNICPNSSRSTRWAKETGFSSLNSFKLMLKARLLMSL